MLIEERMAENEGAGSESEAEDGTGARSNLDPAAEQRVQEAVVAYLLAEPAINERTAYDHDEWDRRMADRVGRLVVLPCLTSAHAPLSAPPSLSQSKTDRLNECE